jgi:hypothetical protein
VIHFFNEAKLKRPVDEFAAGDAPAKSVMFDCRYEDGSSRCGG